VIHAYIQYPTQAFGKPWSKPLVSGDVVGEMPAAADSPAPRSTNEHTAIAKANDVLLLRFDIALSRNYEASNGIYDADALCHLLRQPAGSRSSSEAVALCNLMETVSFCKVILPHLMFEWCRLLEFASFDENDILQEQNSFNFSDFAVFVVISGTVHEHAQPDTQDPDFVRFKDFKDDILPIQKDQKAASTLTIATRIDCLGPFIRSFGVGESFGDRGILSKRCRQSTVIASSKVRCIKISRKKFAEFTKLMPSLAAQPEVVWQLIQTHAERRSEQEKSELLLQLQRLPAFSSLPLDIIADIAAASRGGLFNIGDVVFPVDDESRYFGIILEGEMASFSRDEAALAAFPGMQVDRLEGLSAKEQERLKLMQQRYGTLLRKFSYGSIVGVGALWLPETSSVARLDSAAMLKGRGLQDPISEGVATAYETLAAKGSRVRRTMTFVSLTKGFQVIVVDSQLLTVAKTVLKNTESFFPPLLLAALERTPDLRNTHEHLSLTAYLLTYKYCQRLPVTTVSEFAKHVETILRKKGELVQRQGARPSNFIMPFKGSISMFRVPPPPPRDDDDDEDEMRWADDGESHGGNGVGDDRPRTRGRGGSPRSKGLASRHGSKRMSPSPPPTRGSGVLVECAVPSTAETDLGGASAADDGEDFAGIFGDKIGAVGIGTPVDELALVMNSLSPFTAVVASQVARLFTLPPHLYSRLLQRFHRDELSKLCKDIMQSVPVFRSWTLPKVMNLIRFFEPNEYFRGQRIMSQVANRRSEQRRIVLILAGSCAVEADLPRSSDNTLESEIKARQKEELEVESLRALALSDDGSYKVGGKKVGQVKRAVITMFGSSTVLLDGFAAQPFTYDIVAIEGVSCLELSGDEFAKVNNSTLEYIAEQEAMANSWRTTVVTKLAIIRAPNFSLDKVEDVVDVDSIVDSIHAKKKAEQRAARERSRSPKGKGRRSPNGHATATEVLAHGNVVLAAKALPPPAFGQQSTGCQRVLEATIVPSGQSPNRGHVPHGPIHAPPGAATHSTVEGSDWWASMGILGMEKTGSNVAQLSTLAAGFIKPPAVATVAASTRDFARATFGVKVILLACVFLKSCNDHAI
jgi:CRP-like cAMP-binding protein